MHSKDNYEIIVASLLDSKRQKDFLGMEFKYLPEKYTMISGTIVDQNEFFSILNKLRDMNIQIISVKKIQEVEK
jgi:hypothetical protein